MNTLELIKDAALFGGTVPNERAQEVRDFLDNIENHQAKLKNHGVIGDVISSDVCPKCEDRGQFRDEYGYEYTCPCHY